MGGIGYWSNKSDGEKKMEISDFAGFKSHYLKNKKK